MAFDLQNEPMIASPTILTSNDPSDWLCSQATLMQSVISNSSSTANTSSTAKVRVATGGIGGSQFSGHEYNTLPAALNCPAIDIMSMHAYMSTASQWTPYVPTLCVDSQNVGKHCMIEEWGVGTESTDDSAAVQAAVFDVAGIPWLYWMAILGKSVDETCESTDGSCCHSGLSTDPTQDYEISFTSSRANFTMLFHNASSVSGLQDWTEYVNV